MKPKEIHNWQKNEYFSPVRCSVVFPGVAITPASRTDRQGDHQSRFLRDRGFQHLHSCAAGNQGLRNDSDVAAVLSGETQDAAGGFRIGKAVRRLFQHLRGRTASDAATEGAMMVRPGSRSNSKGCKSIGTLRLIPPKLPLSAATDSPCSSTPPTSMETSERAARRTGLNDFDTLRSDFAESGGALCDGSCVARTFRRYGC